MKILHVLAQLPDRTGSGIYFKNVIDGFGHKNVEQALLFGQQAPFFFDFSPHKCFAVNFLTNQLPFPIAGMSDVMPYEHTVYSQMSPQMVNQWQAAFRQQLDRIQTEFQPDIIISHHLWYLTALVLEMFPDVPVIGISHSTDIRQAQRHPHLVEEYCQGMENLDLVFSLSPQNKSDILATYPISPEKIIVMGNGYNPDIFYPEDAYSRASSTREIRLLYAGKIAHEKGVFELVQTYPHLKVAFPHLSLHLIGNGDASKYDLLMELSQARHLGGVRHDLSLPQKDLAQVMRQSDIFVLPSYYEGLPTIVLEALACGMRVVVSDFPALHQLLDGPINESGWVTYVPLPRRHHQDQPFVEDLPIFKENLTQAIAQHIQAIQNATTATPLLEEAIGKYAWPAIIERQFDYVTQLLQSATPK